MTRIICLVTCVVALAACAGREGAPQQTPEARGQTLVEANCGACHATGSSGDSPAPEAPAFRTLSQNYRVAQLQEALADCVHASVLTGRERAAKRRVLRPRDAAAELLAHEAQGPVALVAGREAHGLTNDEIDRCQTLVTISTDPTYTSLNMAQAIAVMAHELWVTRGGDEIPFKAPRREAPPATMEEYEAAFVDWQRTLAAIDFFKTRQEATVMRSLREVLFRAELDQREAKLFRAMGIEVVNFLRRKGVATVDTPAFGARPEGSGARSGADQ